MVGIGTVISDDPSLTTRLRNRKGKDPLRIVVDSRFRIPLNAKVLNLESESKTIIITGPRGFSKAKNQMNKESVSIISCPTKEDLIDLNALMEMLGHMSVTSLLVEGGSRLMGSLIKENLIDKYYIFKAPKLLGGSDGIPMAHGKTPEKMEDAVSLINIKLKKFGSDTLITGYSGCLPD
jgi:diaminohydroxyphosphoribosylaminopyrimidine deaminase/5-amino-6-(5-phosphoribosylamino)uracil reductase